MYMNKKTEILICGNTGWITEEAIALLTEECRVVLAGPTELSGKQKNLSVYKTRPDEEKFHQLFEVHSFRAVYYISGFADGGEGLFGEMQQLEQVMETCEKSRTDKLVVFSTMDSRNYTMRYGRHQEAPEKVYADSRCFQAGQMEELCRYYMKRSKVCTILLQLPYLADDINDRNYLGKVFHHVYEEHRVSFPYDGEAALDFLTLADLAELMLMLCEETEDESGIYCVSSGYSSRYRDLEEKLREQCPDLDVQYENLPYYMEIPDYSQKLRRRYGFVPKSNAMENLDLYWQLFLREAARSKKGQREKIQDFFTKAGQGIFRYVELILLFLAAEWISQFTSDNVYFRFVDVRLFYIMIMGTMHGMRMGLLAAFLECLALLREYFQLGMNATVLFYNIENWIPFAIYFMSGSITGYVANKKADALRYLKQEYSLLRDKYLFLDQVYHGAVQNKEDYKKQILGFQDSFGKIFDAVQKLDSELPEKIFFEGLRVMEDILENHSIAIYTLDSWSEYGRLSVCSNSMLRKLTKSIRMEEMKELKEAVGRGEIWKNTEMIPGMPMYACGINRGEFTVLLIAVWKAKPDQYGMHYVNIFRILCGLVQTSFLRAVEYEKLTQQEIYYPDTSLVYPERLRQILDIQSAMKEEGVADYVLLRFEDRNKIRVNEKLAGMIRANDVIGFDEEGRIYLLLLQMNQENLKIVGERLRDQGLSFQIAKSLEEQAGKQVNH